MGTTLSWSLVAALLLWFTVVTTVALGFRRHFVGYFREPVLRRPALVLESDDWGAGPLAQLDALNAVCRVLRRHRDGSGRCPAFNLALVLSVPDGQAIALSGVYARLTLDQPVFDELLRGLRNGIEQGLLVPELHGLEHYWPQAVMSTDAEGVAAWVRGSDPAWTERLPAHLQSRWVDASKLPASPLTREDVRTAATEECEAYMRIVGQVPLVVVPPTFVWTREVESAWVACGVEFVVTPGWRSTTRNSTGAPDGDEGPIFNGDRTANLTYLVRSDYFEPKRGRGAAHALMALDRAVAEGRPCILENHRDNFIFDATQCERSLAELDALLGGALRAHPSLRFLATSELGRLLRERDPAWVVRGWRERLPYFWRRVQGSGRLWKLLRLTALSVLGSAVVRLVGAKPASR